MSLLLKNEKIKELSRKYKDYVIALRREFHENPELSWQEEKTVGIIKRELEKMQLDYKVFARTGIVVDIIGNKGDKCILLRADMDALPVEEETNVEYISKNKGVMHACGHDGHMAQLLGAVKILNELREYITGKVRVIFQPAEEVGQGGKKMVEEGVLEGVDSAFAIHLWADIPTGKISIEEGPRMASADNFIIKLKGKGGHGSLPQQCIDPIIAISSLVMNLQSIVSREVDPNESVVLTVGKIQGGTGANIIPNDAMIEGTVRCFNLDLRKKIPNLMERIVKGTCENYRTEYEFGYYYYPAPVINDKEFSKSARESVEEFYGKDSLYEFKKMTTAEDFSAYSTRVPGVLAFVGIKNIEKDCCYPHHHPKFNMDEDALEIGMALYVKIALDFFNNK